jgi:peptidoglycan/LPS O-acetylase OafA/YrhL
MNSPNLKILSTTKYRPDIDGLRAIAVLAVVTFHIFPEWINGGFIGVDIFFVISGFLISTIIFENLKNDTFSFKAFYVNRINRIFPGLCILLAFSLLFGFFYLEETDYIELSKHIVAGCIFMSNILLLSESGYFDKASELKPLLHLWSLGIEEQFYLVFPLMCWCGWQKKINLFKLTTLIFIISYIINVLNMANSNTASFYSPHTRFWEFLAGSMLSWVSLNKNIELINLKTKIEFQINSIIYSIFARDINTSGILNNCLSFLGLFLIIYGLLIINVNFIYPGSWALIPTLGAMLVILAGPDNFLNRKILSNKLIVLIGLISYSVYLIHWPLIWIARSFDFYDLNVKVGIILLSFLSGYLIYIFIEQPIRLSKFKNAIAILLVSILVFIFVSAIATFNGKISNISPLAKQHLNNINSVPEWYRTNKCFLNADKKWEDFYPECFLNESPRNLKSIVIFGDSHAAHLYPGFKKKYENNYKLVQLTQSSCPPLINREFNNLENCIATNLKIIEYIKKSNPYIVILAGEWAFFDWKLVQKTIDEIKLNTDSKIFLMGIAPRYGQGLYKEIKKAYLKAPFDDVPMYCLVCNNKEMRLFFDNPMREYANKANINFVSLTDIMCPEDTNCVARSDDKNQYLYSWDSVHLTKAGSEYAVSLFPKID